MLAERINFEGEPILERRCHHLVFKIDVNAVGLGDLHQSINRLLR